MKWLKNWLRNKEISRLECELNEAIQACEQVYDYCWKDGWKGTANITGKGVLAHTQKIKRLIYSRRKAVK